MIVCCVSSAHWFGSKFTVHSKIMMEKGRANNQPCTSSYTCFSAVFWPGILGKAYSLKCLPTILGVETYFLFFMERIKGFCASGGRNLILLTRLLLQEKDVDARLCVYIYILNIDRPRQHLANHSLVRTEALKLSCKMRYSIVASVFNSAAEISWRQAWTC